MELLPKLRELDFNVSLNEDNNIVISPVSKLTQQYRNFIKKNKVALVCELQLEKLYLRWHVITETDDVYLSVIPPSSLATIRLKFPRAKLIEPVGSGR